MFRGAVFFITTGILALGADAPLFAQSAAADSKNSAPPASPNAAAPAAGDQTTVTDKKDPSAATTAPKPKAKKVWTNDDMGDVHQSSAVSVVGTQKKNNQQPNYDSPPPGQSEYMVKMYRQQIDQLQAQADAIDKQIANLQDAKNGKSVDSSRTYDPWGGKQGDWNSQVAQLEKNRDNILKQIDSVQDMIKKINP
jgi:uncharacterized protein YukE